MILDEHHLSRFCVSCSHLCDTEVSHTLRDTVIDIYVRRWALLQTSGYPFICVMAGAGGVSGCDSVRKESLYQMFEDTQVLPVQFLSIMQ